MKSAEIPNDVLLRTIDTDQLREMNVNPLFITYQDNDREISAASVSAKEVLQYMTRLNLTMLEIYVHTFPDQYSCICIKVPGADFVELNAIPEINETASTIDGTMNAPEKLSL